jgi:DNA processing protein
VHAALCAGQLQPLAGAGTAAPSPGHDRVPAQQRLAAAARQQDVAAGWRQLGAAGVSVLRAGDAGYPARLAADPEPPAVLFVLGTPPPDDRPAVALVGTRACTRYGEEVAAELAGELARAGAVVVSGLAAGIDTAAHAGVLATSGASPLAIVGGGLDVVYPAGNGPLWRAVAASGALLSEAPLGARPEPWRFPQRNRLLAAASDLVVVVESHRHGGALLTAAAALRRQVPVGAVPGSVRSPSSAGCNDLLADGAHVVRDSADVLTLLGLAGAHQPAIGGRGRPGDAAVEPLEEWELRVLGALEERPLALDVVLGRVGGGLLAVADALDRLAERGLARQAGAGWERS